MRLLSLLALFLWLAGSVVAIDFGMEKAEVAKEMGQPVSKLNRNGREVWIYPKNVRIEFEGGKVADIKGLQLPTEKTDAAPVPAAAPKPVKAEDAAAKAAAKAAADADAQLEKQMAAEDAKARAALEKSIGEMEDAHDKARTPPPPPPFNYLGFGIGLVVKCGLTLAAIVLSCKYWGVEVAWNGMLIVAAADTGVRAAVGIVGEVLMKMPSLFYADEALGAIVMLILLKRVSYNHSLGQAVQITMTTKTFTVVVGSFLVTVLMRALA